MKDVKKQILEFIAVGRLKDEQLSGRDSTEPITIEGSDRDGRGASGSIANKVLCLIGPPG
jgi:ATP-dependent Lon protease